MEDIITATPVAAPKTATVYVLMVRYGMNFWCTHNSYEYLEDAVGTTQEFNERGPEPKPEAWRIVRVDNLPVRVPEGEV